MVNRASARKPGTTIFISLPVWGELNKRKKPSRSFNEVLEEMLGLGPGGLP